MTKQENTAIQKLETTALLQLGSEYKTMLQEIGNKLPMIKKSSAGFYKLSSQFKTSVLDLTAVTPLRALEQILADVEQTKSALEDANIKLQKNNIELQILQNKIALEENQLARESFIIDEQEILLGMARSENYIKGAIRKLSYLTVQCDNILTKLGVDHITEEMYEEQEYRYHIMTAFKQALSAARSHGGTIDEGNQIYMFELGINGAVAQVAITNYLQAELNMLQEGRQPTHRMTIDWLEACANEFCKNPEVFAAWRGFTLKESNSMDKFNGEV